MTREDKTRGKKAWCPIQCGHVETFSLSCTRFRGARVAISDEREMLHVSVLDLISKRMVSNIRSCHEARSSEAAVFRVQQHDAARQKKAKRKMVTTAEVGTRCEEQAVCSRTQAKSSKAR